MSEDGVEPLLRLRFPARADQLRRVRDAVREQTAACGFSAQCAGDVVLAIDEACQNVIRHAYCGDSGGEIVLEIERRGEILVFSLRDFAPPIDPDRVKPRDLDDVRPGGARHPLHPRRHGRGGLHSAALRGREFVKNGQAHRVGSPRDPSAARRKRGKGRRHRLPRGRGRFGALAEGARDPLGVRGAPT